MLYIIYLTIGIAKDRCKASGDQDQAAAVGH